MNINVQHIAKLANLTLTSDEEKKFEKQLTEILLHVDRLKDVHTENIAETSQSTGLENITREDVADSSLSQEEALSNAPAQHNGMFLVEGILHND